MMYIRHANKEYKNGGSTEFSLDPGITEAGRTTAQTYFTDLILTYGPPRLIVSSPYLRARETATIAHEVIQRLTGIDVTITCDAMVGEYLGHQTHRNIYKCLRPDTLQYQPIPPETWKQYGARIRSHIKTAKCNTWYITHGLVIQSVAHFHGMKIDHPHELHGILLQDSTIRNV
jgi:broad specificity phosphatase PhoE